ncbi:binding--dependent transport system inner membrane component family protein (plasmid) [Burkholderia pseudomallei]|uniref:Binding--dependent transport system inner membrane component family protein n=1 Tax=Burkholderia pseudomallei TaxID=28450 RepID=A0AA40JJC8_BURPE|nr:carbohydrate ABC transporter permease [Burkholderia pseudomallei]AIV73748.1 binding--dependent transport system inner membrane component family protein [Burkholderia pseudomallei]KGD54730.1 binding--dependent transport system inner membrane component family protein [Burkholderia pseudomallei]KGS74162.1 binding--dependent transport system inner membrane component family protein [Burkholderia pseudomallei MSHR5596]KGW80283.1 binding--dependent transport system inner membrane component family p
MENLIGAVDRPAPAWRGMRFARMGSRAFDIFNAVLLLTLCAITFYPFWYVLAASLSDPVQLAAHRGLLLLPQGFSLEAFERVWANPAVRSGYLNTLIIVVGGTTINMVTTCLGAYALSRKRLSMEKPLMLVIIFTMFFTGGLVPQYLLVRNLGLLDTFGAILLPFAVNAWNLIILRTAFNALPKDYEDAARIDGAGHFTILWRVYVPLCAPTLAVIGLFYAVSHWNGYFYAMMYFSNRDMYPLQLVLREVLVASNTESMMTGAVSNRAEIGQTIKYATIIAATLPVLAVYPFLQRYFVRGMMVGGIKE